jgi:hypothetical protein
VLFRSQLKALGVAATGSGTAASGTTAASGSAASDQSGKGGRIEVTGQRVALTGAALDASGPAGGGTVLLGGDVRGANPAVPNASSTNVDAASTVRADALAKGDGGTVVLWSEQQTSFAGTTSARGGPSGGDGGLLEVSSKGGVGFSGAVDAAAPAGKAGSVLFDPKNIIIDSSANILAETNLTFGETNANWDPNTNSAILTPSMAAQAGSFFYKTALSLNDNPSFSTSFQFKISNSSGDQGGADGLVFVIKNSNANTIGGNGGGIGYKGISNSLGIEFDTYNNGSYNDPNGNHVGINLNGSMESSMATNIQANFNNGLPWSVWIDYNDQSKSVDVRLANNSNSRPVDPALTYTFENGKGLKDIIAEGSGPSLASFGFTAATGEATGKHEILSWSLYTSASSSSSSNPSGDLLLQPTQIQAIANQGTNVLLQANNDITLMPNSSITIQSPTAGSGGISMQAGRSIILQSPITYVGEYSGPINLIANDTSLLPSFRDIGAGNLTVDTGATLTSSQALVSLRLGPGNDVYSPGVLQVNAPISASTVLARGASGITLAEGATLTASAPSGRAITLDAGSSAFFNNSTFKAAALSKQPGATWAIYADNPTSTPSVNLGSLPYSFKQYNQTFDTNQESNPILGSGNGLFFANSPTISVNLLPVSKDYDGKVEVNLSASNYNVTGILEGDLVKIKPAVGTYVNKNAGNDKLVSVSGLTIANATESASEVAVFGYNLSSTEASEAIGTITPLLLSGAAIAPGSSIYGSALAPGAVSFGNIVGSDVVGSSAAVNTEALSTSLNPIVGTYSQSASALTGVDAGNYSFSGFTTATSNYTINKLALTGAAIAPGSSIYGTALAPGAVSFGNMVGSDAVGSSAAVNTEALSTSLNPIVGTYSQSASALTGADAGNYSFSGFISTPNYTISKLDLTGASITPGSSIYGSALTPGAVSFGNIVGSGVVGSSAAVNTNTLSTSLNPIVGTYSQSASALTGVDAGNYSFSGFTTATSNYTINKLSISGAAITPGSSIYGTALTPGAVSFGNIVGSDVVGSSAAVNTEALSTSLNPIVGTYSQSASTLTGVDAGNYSFSGLISTPNYTISKLDLTGAEIGSGSSIYGSTLAPGAVSFGNIVGSDVVGSNAYVNTTTVSTSLNPIVGTYSQSASALTGVDAGNYSFSGFTSAKNYNISRAPLTPSFTTNDKLFDGNTIATIAGYNLQGVLTGDDVSMAEASANFNNAFAGNNKPVTIDGFALSGPEVNNYQLSSNIATATASITPRAVVPPNEEPITPRPGIGAFPANEEPNKNNHANPGIGLQSATISSLSNLQFVEIDSSNISPSASVAAASNATSTGPDPSQPTPSASAVSADSAAQDFQESDQRSAEGANTSLGLSNAGAGVAMSPARLQQLMQSAADLIRRYPGRLLNP